MTRNFGRVGMTKVTGRKNRKFQNNPFAMCNTLGDRLSRLFFCQSSERKRLKIMETDHYSPLARKILDTIRKDPVNWAISAGVSLRPYQRQIALAIKDSVIHQAGRSFVVILPRQSGKNELQAHLFAWLLFRAANSGGRIVSVSPTFKPQTYNSMDRVAASLDASLGARGLWKSSNGFIYRLGKARLQFFSGDSSAKVVGATADLLLSVDEAQQISPAKFDKDFDPMTASANATRVFWGTAWTSDTLLERQRRLASQAERQDGIQRVFFYTADDIRRLVPQYGRHVDRVVAEQGRNHPLVKTQYFCETIDAQSGLFNAARLALIQSDRPFLSSPDPALRGPVSGGAGGGPPTPSSLTLPAWTKPCSPWTASATPAAIQPPSQL